MLRPISSRALDLLCNVLIAHGSWFENLTRYGLASWSDYADVMNSGEPAIEADFLSWKSLRGYIEDGRTKSQHQLLQMCGDLLRNKEDLAQKAKDKAAFLDSLAHLQVSLAEGGFNFDGFDLVYAGPSPIVTALSSERLEEFLATVGKGPSGLRVVDHFAKAETYLRDGEHVECQTNLRLAMKHTFEGIARAFEARSGNVLSSDKENEVRDYLKRINFMTEEEWRGAWGIYGLLSSGAHGKGDSIDVLCYVSALLFCVYAVEKYLHTL